MIINFADPHQGAAVAMVRSVPGAVRVTLSIQSNGDAEVLMSVTDAERFSQALLEAIKVAKGSSDDGEQGSL